MKTIEEKAKAYDEAIKKAAALYKASEPMSSCNVIIENLFPELKNSEDEKIESEDEKIRHYLMNFVKINDGVNLPPDYAKKALAWLEKQKDCIKLSDSAYTSNRDVIEFADKYSRTVWEKLMDKFKKNENYSIGCNDVSDIVLNAIINTYNWLERQGEQKASCTTIVETGDGGINALVTLPIEMKTAEESLGVDSDTYKKIVDECIFGEQKPEENKGNIGGISPNWSEEDEKEMTAIEHHLNNCGASITSILWLKSLKDRVGCEANCTTTKEWSEEDKNFMYDTLSNLTELKDRYGEGYGNVGKCIDWLKSLRPQNHWKPSELQLGCLSDAIEHYNSLGYPAPKLKELYEQLKKLKEE